MYELGKHLRERYDHLLILNGNTVAEDVQMVSTPVHRCYQSGALLLSGFYPPNRQQIWNDELFWQPIPIRSTSPDKIYVRLLFFSLIFWMTFLREKENVTGELYLLHA